MSSQSSQSELQAKTLSATANQVPVDRNAQNVENAQDEQSIISAESLYTVIDGRTFTSQSGTYMLPADEEEHRRLNIQHNLLRISLGGLFAFPELVAPLLHEGQAEPPRVLDVGTGSGQWALDTAAAYPWAEVIGIDLVPPALISRDKIPPNCRFEIKDANLVMEHFTNTFSVIHARSVGTGINDVNSFFYQVARGLKRGGVLFMVEPTPQLRDENLTPYPFVEPGQPGFTWFQYIWGQARHAWVNRGCKVYALWWKEWLESNPNYSEVRQRDLDIPIGAWKEGMTDQETIAANMMRENISNVLESWRSLLLADGHPAEDVNLWIEECRKELKEMRVHCNLRFMYFAAVRSNTPWQDRGDWTPPDENTRELIKGHDARKPQKRRSWAAPGVFETA